MKKIFIIFILLLNFLFLWYFVNFTYGLNLTPILLNKIQKNTVLYLIKNTDWKYKFIKLGDPIIEAHPKILTSSKVRYNISQSYPWITNNNVKFWYSIKNSAKNNQLEVIWKILNRKNIFNNFYYTYPFIRNSYSSLTVDWTKTYIHDNDNDNKDLNKEQYPTFINSSLLNNYWRIYNLNWNYDDNIYAANGVSRKIYYYDISDDTIKSVFMKVAFTNNYLLSLIYDKDNNNIKWTDLTAFNSWKIYSSMVYKDAGEKYLMDKRTMLNIIKDGMLFSPIKYIWADWDNLKWEYLQQSISKRTYNILPWAPLIPITLSDPDKSIDENYYFKKWKDLFDYIDDNLDSKLKDINEKGETSFAKFSKEFPTYMFWSDNSINNKNIDQKKGNAYYQYDNLWTKKDNIFSILNYYWYNFLTMGNIKPIYWTLKEWGNTATLPESLTHNIFYTTNYDKKEYITVWMLWINDNFIWKTGWFIDTYKLHNNMTKWFSGSGYSVHLKWDIYNITYPAVVSNIDIANQCSKKIADEINNGSGIVDCTLLLNWDTWIKIKKLDNNGNINKDDIHNYQKIEIKIKVIKQSFDNTYHGILYYINFWKILLNDLNTVKLISNDKDQNWNNITYSFTAHVFVNKLLPWLKDVNKDLISYLLRNNIYNKYNSDKYFSWLNGHWLYGYPIFIREEKDNGSDKIINPIDELYEKAKNSDHYHLKVIWKSIPFWVNFVYKKLIDNFINTDALWPNNNWIYHNLMFFSETANWKTNFSYQFNWNQLIKETDFKNVINNWFKFNKTIDNYNYSNVRTFFPKSNGNKFWLKTYNDLLKTLYLNKAVDFTHLDNPDTEMPDPNKYYKIINNYIFSEIYNHEIKEYYTSKNEDYDPIVFFKRLFSYGHLEISYLSSLNMPLYSIIQNQNILQSQRNINIKQLYNGSEKDEKHPISYGNDLYKYNNLEDFTLSSYQWISTIANLANIYYEDIISKDPQNHKFLEYWWIEHDLDDHWNKGLSTQSSMWYNVLMTSWILYPFLNTLVNYSQVNTNSEILTNPNILDRNINVKIADADSHNLSWIWTSWKYIYEPYYNAIKQLSKRSKILSLKILNEKDNFLWYLSINWLYPNKLSIINSYPWKWKDPNGTIVSDILSPDKSDYNSNLDTTDVDKKELYLYKWLPLQFLFTTWNLTTEIIKQSIDQKLSSAVFWYDYNNNKWFVKNGDSSAVNILRFTDENALTKFNNDYNKIYNKIIVRENNAAQAAKKDCSNMSEEDKIKCLKNKIINSENKLNNYFIYKWTTDSEKDLRNLIKWHQLTILDLVSLGTWRSCDLTPSITPSILIPKYIPSKKDGNEAYWKLMLVQEGIISFTNWSLIKCTNNDSSKWILLISSDLLLPAKDNNIVYYIPENSNVDLLVNNPIDGLSKDLLAKTISQGILNKIFWAAWNKEMNDMSKIVFNKFDNSNINGLYYQIINNIEWNFDKLATIKNINYNIKDIISTTFYNSNVQKIDGFLPKDNNTYYLSLSSAKEYWIWTPTIDPVLENSDWTKWIYNYMDLFWKFWDSNNWSVNNLDKFFKGNKSDIEWNMINDVNWEDTIDVIKPAISKLLWKIKSSIKANNKWLIINNINAIILDKDNFKNLYNIDLDPWTMFLIVDIDMDDLDNGNEHLVIPYILTWGTIMKDIINKQTVEYIPYKFDELPEYANIFKFWDKDLVSMIDPNHIDCNNNICVWDYNKIKDNSDVKHLIDNMITIKSNYLWTHKYNNIKGSDNSFDFNFSVVSSSNNWDNNIQLPYDFSNKKWYIQNKDKKRFKWINMKVSNLEDNTYKEKELNNLLLSFYKTFNFVYYKIDYKTSNIKVNLDKDTNNNFIMPYNIQNNTFNDDNDKINNNFISDLSKNNKSLYKQSIYDNIFEKYTDGFNYNKRVIDNWKIKWLIFNVHDKLFNLSVSEDDDVSSLNNYIQNNVYKDDEKGLEWLLNDNLNSIMAYLGNSNISKAINEFNTLYVPFDWTKNLVCKATTVYSEEDNPADKSINNWVYTTIEGGQNGTISINSKNYDWEITNSVEKLADGTHKIKLYIKNNNNNDCDSLTLSWISISSTNINKNGKLIINWTTENIDTNGTIDISWKNITIKKWEYKEIELDVQDVNSANYSSPTVNITISYKQPNSSNVYNSNKLSLKFIWKTTKKTWLCSQIKCKLINVSPADSQSISLSNGSHTNAKYYIDCSNWSKKDINQIKYVIHYSDDSIYPSFLDLDPNWNFSNIISRLKQGQTIKWYGESNNANIIDNKLFIINSIKSDKINFSTTISWTYDLTMEDWTKKTCNLNSLVYKASMTDSNWNGNTGGDNNSNSLNNYNECYITNTSNKYNTTPYNIQWFINNDSSNSSFIKQWYLYLKFYKLQQNNEGNNIPEIPTYRFNTTDLVNESWAWRWVNDMEWWEIGEYNKIIYTANVSLPSYITLKDSDLVNRIKNQEIKIKNKIDLLQHLVNWYHIKITRLYWKLKTNSKTWNYYCDYSSVITKITNYDGNSNTNNTHSWNKPSGSTGTSWSWTDCLLKTTAEIKLYMNTELDWLSDDHETPEVVSRKVYSIQNTFDYGQKKAWYVISTYTNYYAARDIFKNNPYAYFDQIMEKSKITELPFVELWIPIIINKPKTTGNTTLVNTISGNQLLTNSPIVCKSNLDYQKIWYKWVDTSRKDYQTLYISKTCGLDWVRTYYGYGPVGHEVNLNWYGIYYWNPFEDISPTPPPCNSTHYYKLRSWVNIPYKWLSNVSIGMDKIPWNYNYQIVLKQVWPTYSLNDKQAVYRFYPTILSKWWTQYVWVYNINKADSKKYNFMSNPKDKEVYGSVITDNSKLWLTTTNKTYNQSSNYILPLNTCYKTFNGNILDLKANYDPDERWYCEWWYKPLYYWLLTDSNYNQQYINENILTNFNNSWLLDFPSDKFKLYIYNAADNTTNQLYIWANNNKNLKIKNVWGIFFTNDLRDLTDNTVKVNITWNIIKSSNDFLDNTWKLKANNLTLFVNGNLYIGKNVSLLQANLIVSGNVIVEDSDIPLTIQWYVYIKWSLINKRKQVSIANNDPLTWTNKPSVRVIEDPSFGLLDLPFKNKIVYLEKDN